MFSMNLCPLVHYQNWDYFGHWTTSTLSTLFMCFLYVHTKKTDNATTILFFFSQVTAGETLTCGIPQAVKWSISVIQIMYFRAGREFMDSCSIGNIHHSMHCSSLLCCCNLHGWHPLHIQPSWREGSLLCVFFQGVSSLSLFRVFFGGVPFTRFEVPFERNCTCDNEM